MCKYLLDLIGFNSGFNGPEDYYNSKLKISNSVILQILQ